MRKATRPLPVLLAFIFTGFFFSSLSDDKAPFTLPYKKAGLTDKQAAAHLLSRFSYGPTPGQVAAVAEMGPENWLREQLDGKMPDDALNQRLEIYDAIDLSNEQVAQTYPKPGQIIRIGVKEGIISKDSVNKSDKSEYRAQLKQLMDSKGMKPQQELFRQFFNQKILRAAYSNNQFREIMTDFWFNHFNVSLTKNDCATYVPAYEREVIRPNVFGRFNALLMATAKSPAMLYYLDNFSSSGANARTPDPRAAQLRKRVEQRIMAQGGRMDTMNNPVAQRLQQAKKAQGLNENYAREVMELHTLGVDGGYTQEDVTQAARVLTGWTVNPAITGYVNPAVQKAMANAGLNRQQRQGGVTEGDFLFAANRHDPNEKTVLGKNFPANGGMEEGEALLNMLARHPSTAKFISKKIAIRFVSDNPPQSLVDRMAKTFTDKDGDIREVIYTMVSSPEFWSKEALREKTKSPFELAMSSARALNADIRQPYQLYTWIAKMGQKMYYYQAPTGFPDKGHYWINTGSLLNRMNFGLALASQRIPGVTIDLAALNDHHEPESAVAALVTYSKLVMPERDIEATVKRLTPMLNDPNLEKKIDAAAGKTAPPAQPGAATMTEEPLMASAPAKKTVEQPLKKNAKNTGNNTSSYAPGTNTMLAQVIGIIIGSPEFQRK
ncbi:DUF1800 domain-containing protein [Hufsiella ginkgonis]|uniref:DUF1800 family protein n=1 Tax=Hufsiella ginkgonis TaxID=2695274 RepID=A0A7K1XY85_9SPHI|nr:DUF1800 domain-containing protein [Hufsiella ginkgonis]MXV15709.1 DUF1800 family protein [Hufsiella ginkgonis]